MTSEVKAEKSLQPPPGSLGLTAQPPCKMSAPSETAVLETPCVGAPVDSPRGAHTSTSPPRCQTHEENHLRPI